MLLATFTLPVHADSESSAASDSFHVVRRMWEDCGAVFIKNVSPSWLIIIDEFMLKWVGVGMPGLMVVPRKPTPMGLELHTMCCAVSGILTNVELCEGKERLELKQYVGEPTEF
eukprot:6182964-Pleurochrysis_carterae.AAC.1